VVQLASQSPPSEPVRAKATQAELLAHVLDDVITVPGTRVRLGVDPLLGVLPLYGDTLATALGVTILLIGRQLRVPFGVLSRMSYHLFLNGVLGSVPIFGDLFSLWYRSNAKNAALLLRALAQRDRDACPIFSAKPTLLDVLVVLLLTLPILLLVFFLSRFFWERGIGLL
jgi:Domain of unknown function (DUF4112)